MQIVRQNVRTFGCIYASNTSCILFIKLICFGQETAKRFLRILRQAAI